MALELVLPRRYRPKFFCLVPGCGAKFRAGQERAYQEHVAKCSADHHDELEEMRKRRRPPGFYDSPDPEFQAWAKLKGAAK